MLVADLENESQALRSRDRDARDCGRGRLAAGALWRQIDGADGRPIVVPHYRVERSRVDLEPGEGQAPPTVVARLSGTVEPATYAGTARRSTHRGARRASRARSSSC